MDIDKIIQKSPLFEIPVTDIKTCEIEYITCDPVFNYDTNTLTVLREDVSTEEENNSENIAFNSIVIDEDLTIDENLYNLFEQVQISIINGDIYRLGV